MKSPSTVNFSLGVLLNLVLLFHTLLLSFAFSWPWLVAVASLWGRLMQNYSRTTDQLDVIRGRTVPAPPSPSSRPHRVLNSLNPYSGSQNIRLVMDLIAAKCGVGLAFKCLASVEPDVRENWKPLKLDFGLVVVGEEEEEESTSSLEVTWKDPLAVLYLSPVPCRKIQLHFALSVSFSSSCPCPDEMVRVVGHDETRYYQQVWRSSRPGKVQLGGGGGSKEEDEFSYREVFHDIPGQVYGANVEVWTVVDGQTIAKATEFRYVRSSSGGSECSCCCVGGGEAVVVAAAARNNNSQPSCRRNRGGESPESAHNLASIITESIRARSLTDLVVGGGTSKKAMLRKSKSQGNTLQQQQQSSSSDKKKKANARRKTVTRTDEEDEDDDGDCFDNHGFENEVV